MSDLSSTPRRSKFAFLAKEATEILREYSSDLLFNRCVRASICLGQSGAIRKSCGLMQNSSTSRRHFTISV